MIKPYKPQYIEKLFTDPNGRQFRLIFLVTLVNGELKGRLISAEAIGEPARLSGSVRKDPFYLSSGCANKIPCVQFSYSTVPVKSPYVSLDFLITSQPTRAPSRQ